MVKDRTKKELLDFLTEERKWARKEIKNIANYNCVAHGYEVGIVDIINRTMAFIKGDEYDFGKDY